MISVVVMAAVLALAVPAAAQQTVNPNRLTVALSDPNRPATLDVRVFEGALAVRTHAAREILIMARGERDAFGQNGQAQGLRRLTTGRLSVDENNNVVTIRSDRPDSADLDILVPVRTNLKLQSMNEEITVEGVEGDIEVTAQNDNVVLLNVSGSVVAHSQNDDVRVVMTQVTADKDMAFSSVNGDVDVTLPSTTRANLKMNTVNGDIYTDFDVQITDEATTSRRSRESAISGTINNGGPLFELRSVNGNVYIRRGR